MTHIIWANDDINIDNWKDFLEECYPAVTDPDEQYELCCEENDSRLQDEQANLSIVLDEEIVAIADIGLWDGVKHGYRECHTRTIGDLLYLDRDCYYGCFYVDESRNLRSRQTHHDGTNHILYRVWKTGLSQEDKDDFLEKLYTGTATEHDVDAYTQSIGEPVCAVYGW